MPVPWIRHGIEGLKRLLGAPFDELTGRKFLWQDGLINLALEAATLVPWKKRSLWSHRGQMVVRGAPWDGGPLAV